MRQEITRRFGRAIREKRLQLGLTQDDLSRLTGLNRSYISDVERGKESISLERAAQLADAVEAKLWELIKD